MRIPSDPSGGPDSEVTAAALPWENFFLPTSTVDDCFLANRALQEQADREAL